MPRLLVRAILDASLDMSQAATDSAVTIAHRLPILAKPGAEGAAEWQACAAEKAAAAWDGAVDMISAWQANMLAAFSGPLTPAGYARQSLALVRVASHPAHVRVRANAARFDRG